MQTRRGWRIALAFTVALTGSAASAGAADGAQAGWKWPELARSWSWLTAAWLAPETVQIDCGIHIDPNGRCLGGAVQASSDRGSQIDPNGQTTSDPDRGIFIDPNG
jgi:hypothetical protein